MLLALVLLLLQLLPLLLLPPLFVLLLPLLVLLLAIAVVKPLLTSRQEIKNPTSLTAFLPPSKSKRRLPEEKPQA